MPDTLKDLLSSRIISINLESTAKITEIVIDSKESLIVNEPEMAIKNINKMFKNALIEYLKCLKIIIDAKKIDLHKNSKTVCIEELNRLSAETIGLIRKALYKIQEIEAKYIQELMQEIKTYAKKLTLKIKSNIDKKFNNDKIVIKPASLSRAIPIVPPPGKTGIVWAPSIGSLKQRQEINNLTVQGLQKILVHNKACGKWERPDHPGRQIWASGQTLEKIKRIPPRKRSKR